MSNHINQPSYHNQMHMNMYDVESTRLDGGGVQAVMDTLDEILYPDSPTVIRPKVAVASGQVFKSYFLQDYPQVDIRNGVLSVETVILQVVHTRYLGNAALKQTYEVQHETQINQDDITPQNLATIYHLDQVAGTGQVFFGTMLRPNIVGAKTRYDEQMTVYDCSQLFSQLADVVGLAAIDARSRSRLET